MTAIRVVVADIPVMIRDLIREALADQHDLVIVGEAEEREEAVRIAIDQRADVLITECKTEQLPKRYQELLLRLPTLGILSILSDGGSAELYTLKLDLQRIESIGMAELLAALRMLGKGQALS